MASSSKEAALTSQGRRESKELPSIRCLGKGLSGIIYETTWLGNRYARKDFPLGSVKHNDVFEKEAKSLLDLDHPNIVKCYGYTIGKSSCSLLQGYVDNNLQNTREKKIEDQRKKAAGSNTTFESSRVLPAEKIKPLFPSMVQEAHVSSNTLENTRLFELPMAVDIIFQIATGMEYLHDHGVAHGDLKPSNVLLQWESGVLKVKVADFGLIETKKRIKLVSKRARHYEILLWKAPERLEKLLGPLTETSNDPFTDSDTNSDESGSYENFKKSKLAMADVYSFGLTCLYILSEEVMYKDLSLTQLREKRTLPSFKPKLKLPYPEYLELLIYSIFEFEFSRRPTFSYIRLFLEMFHLKHIPRLLKVEGMEDGVIGTFLPLINGGLRKEGREKDDQVIEGMKIEEQVAGRMKKGDKVIASMENKGQVVEMESNNSNIEELKKDDQVIKKMKNNSSKVQGMKKDGDVIRGLTKDGLVIRKTRKDGQMVGRMKKDGKKFEKVEKDQIDKLNFFNKPQYEGNINSNKKKEKSWQSGVLNQHSVEYLYEGKYRDIDLFEEESANESLDETEDVNYKVYFHPQERSTINAPYSKRNPRQHKTKTYERRPSRQQFIKTYESRPSRQQIVKTKENVEDSIYHDSFRKRNNYTLSNSSWRDEIFRIQEQREFEFKKMKEMILDVRELCEEFMNKRIGSSL